MRIFLDANIRGLYGKTFSGVTVFSPAALAAKVL
jgi:hypothetical protein